MKKIRMLTTASLALVTFLAGGGVMKAVSAEADYESLRRFSQILDMVEQYYVNEVSQKELLDGALKGMLENLDPHSTLMTKKEFQEMQENTSGEFFGVGIEITMQNGQVLVVTDMLGMTNGFSPRFLRRYADLHSVMTNAISQYVEDVKNCDFPNEKEQY